MPGRRSVRELAFDKAPTLRIGKRGGQKQTGTGLGRGTDPTFDRHDRPS